MMYLILIVKKELKKAPFNSPPMKEKNRFIMKQDKKN